MSKLAKFSGELDRGQRRGISHITPQALRRCVEILQGHFRLQSSDQANKQRN